MNDTITIVLSVTVSVVVTALIAALIFYFYSKKMKVKIVSSEKNAQKVLEDAKTKASQIVEEAQKEAKNSAEEYKKSQLKEYEEKRNELKEAEIKNSQRQDTLNQKELVLDKKEEALLSKENILEERKLDLDNQSKKLTEKEAVVDSRKADLEKKIDEAIAQLEDISKMSMNEAKDELMKKVEEKEVKKIALYKEKMEEQAQSEAEDRAKTLLALSLEKYAQEVTTDHSTSTVVLPNDDMKGRIIGREGRNIKSMEQLFGVSLIIDDTPEIISLSCFDPIRREKARLTLEALIKDGRIQPGRIEELYAKISTEFDESLKRIGEQTIFKLGLPRISPNLLIYIGRLKYRTSYGQNVLDHSIQVAYLSSVMASELGLDPIVAKRAGLLHDIGKSVDCEMEGSHVQLGRDLAKKYGESDEVINAIESHHGDVEKKYLISEIVTAADTLSAARPGARSETLETYIKRLEAIEEICKSFEGVQSSYALQSGRDVRVMVVPEKVSDDDAKVIASQIRDRIENEVNIPGQIKISVIREMRAVEIAKK